MRAIVYLLTSPAGLPYVGQTRRGLETRWAEHVKGWQRWVDDGRPTYTYSPKLFEALDEYPHWLWTRWELYVSDDFEAINLAEIELISSYDSIDNGYNTQHGGGGWAAGEMSEEHKQKLSLSRSRYYDTPEGMAWKEVLRERFREANPSEKGRVPWNKGQECPQIGDALRGREFSDETKRSMSRGQTRRWSENPESFAARDEAATALYTVTFTDGTVVEGVSHKNCEEFGFPPYMLGQLSRKQKGSEKYAIASVVISKATNRVARAQRKARKTFTITLDSGEVIVAAGMGEASQKSGKKESAIQHCVVTGTPNKRHGIRSVVVT